MKPIGKYIIIKAIEEQVKTDSGLILSAEETSNLRYKKGEVVKVGTDVDVIKPDDIIYYDQRTGHTMLINDNVFTIILEKDIVVVV